MFMKCITHFFALNLFISLLVKSDKTRRPLHSARFNSILPQFSVFFHIIFLISHIASGLDSSGSNYITSSSYANGSLVRSGGRNSTTGGGGSTTATTTATTPSTSGSSY